MTTPAIPPQRVALLPLSHPAPCVHRPAWARGASTLLRIDNAQLILRLAPCQHCDVPLLGVSSSADEDADLTWFVVAEATSTSAQLAEVDG